MRPDFSIDTTKAPVFVGTDGPNTSIFRYWTTGTYTSGTVQITFIAGSYGFTDGSTNTFTGPVAPEHFTVDDVATPNLHYVDVQLTPTNGDSLDLSSITDTTPELVADRTRRRHGAVRRRRGADAAARHLGLPLLLGAGAVRPAARSPSPSSPASSARAARRTGRVHEPRQDRPLHRPAADGRCSPTRTSGGLVGVDTVNGRSFVDVTFTLPSYAVSLDVSSVTDLAPEFTIAPQNASDGTIALDATQAPILMSQTATSYTFRYFTTGTLHGANAVLTYLGGSASFLDTAGQSIPLFASEQVTVVNDATAGQFAIDVPFGTSGLLDTASVNGGEITASGATLTFEGQTSSTQIGTYRYRISGSGIAAGSHVTIAFVAGAWTYGGAASVVQGTSTLAVSADTYIDVHYNSAGGVALNTDSIDGNELTLGGAGIGTAALDTGKAPTILADGQTVRYYVSGHFAPGTVSVAFAAGSWSDTAGNLGTAGSATFKVIDQVQPPRHGRRRAASSSSRSPAASTSRRAASSATRRRSRCSRSAARPSSTSARRRCRTARRRRASS